MPEQPLKPTGAESVKPYADSERDKGGQVEEMFDSIAPAYDLMNTAMTFGMHRIWRRRALRRVAGALCGKVLDVATGTGDLAFFLRRHYGSRSITGIDLSAGMLAVARRKLAMLPEPDRNAISFMEADCLALPFADNSFDAVTVAYGVRNFERLLQGIREMQRVLRPGGSICIIELSEPRMPHLRMMYRLYARHVIPAVGRMVSGDCSAYTYLPMSIAAAPQREAMTKLMRQAGLRDTAWRTMTFGSVCVYTAVK